MSVELKAPTNIQQRLENWKKDASGFHSDIRDLLSTLHNVVWKDCEWQKIDHSELKDAKALKRAYHRALVAVNPDSNPTQPTARTIFEALTAAYHHSQGGGQPTVLRIVDPRRPSDISEILDGLYLGSVTSACDDSTLSSLGVKLVVNCTSEISCYFPRQFEYMRVNVFDMPDEQISSDFDRVSDAIHARLSSKQAVLVHCASKIVFLRQYSFAAVGMSRSASFVIAYLMRHHSMTLLQAYHHTLARRSIIEPNPGFLAQLQQYEVALIQSKLDSSKVERKNAHLDGIRAGSDASKHGDSESKAKDKAKEAEQLQNGNPCIGDGSSDACARTEFVLDHDGTVVAGSDAPRPAPGDRAVVLSTVTGGWPGLPAGVHVQYEPRPRPAASASTSHAHGEGAFDALSVHDFPPLQASVAKPATAKRSCS